SLMSFENVSSRIGRNGASNRSGAYDRLMMRTMRLVGKTATRTVTAEQSFWPYGRSAHGVAATFSTASAIDLIRCHHLRHRRITGSSGRQDEHVCAIQRARDRR